MYRVSNDQNFCLKLGKSYDKHMLEISKRYLKWFLNNHWFTEKFLTASALVQAFCLSSAKIAWTKADVDQNFLVNWWLFKNHWRYLFEILAWFYHIHKSPNLTWKFWSLLTWYNSSTPYYAKTLKASSGRICQDIFEKNFWGWF